MTIDLSCPGTLGIGVEYPWRRSASWEWNGSERWWEVSVVVTGWNGGGGYCVEERWRWNGSSQVMTRQPRNLTREQSRDLEESIAKQDGAPR